MYKVWLAYFKTLISNKKGQGMVEYGLIIGLVAVVLIGALIAMRTQIAEVFQSITTSLQGGGGGGGS